MSQWGLWQRYDKDELHVVPCDHDGNVLGGHLCTPTCWCKPRPDPDTPGMHTHNDPERGGCNA